MPRGADRQDRHVAIRVATETSTKPPAIDGPAAVVPRLLPAAQTITRPSPIGRQATAQSRTIGVEAGMTPAWARTFDAGNHGRLLTGVGEKPRLGSIELPLLGHALSGSPNPSR